MLVCTSLKAGRPCVFMSKNGCSYNGGKCHPVIDSCHGCENIEVFEDTAFCKIFAEPYIKWSLGPCNMATHLKATSDNKVDKRINPLKASKRKAR